MKKRFSEAQIIGFLREAETGVPIKDLCRRHGFSEASYYLWRSKFGGMSVSDAKRLKELDAENMRLKKLLAEVAPGKRGDARGVTKKMVTAPTRRTVVRNMTEHGLSERRALAVVGMSASSLRYTPAPDRNRALRARIVALAHRHRRYGAGMIYLKLRQAGRAGAITSAWSACTRRQDSRCADGAARKSRPRSGSPWGDHTRRTRSGPPTVTSSTLHGRRAGREVLDDCRRCDRRGRGHCAGACPRGRARHTHLRVVWHSAREPPRRILRTDNGPEFCGRAMLTWAHARGVTLRLIEPGKPNQNAVH